MSSEVCRRKWWAPLLVRDLPRAGVALPMPIWATAALRRAYRLAWVAWCRRVSEFEDADVQIKKADLVKFISQHPGEKNMVWDPEKKIA
jgi:hypothetical protein